MVVDPERIVLGTAQWGMAYGVANRSGQPGPELVAEILATAREGGITTLDTARAYGSSEEVVGALDQAAEWRVITKLDANVAPPGADAAAVRERAETSLSVSRTALRRSTLDTVLLHRGSQLAAADGAAWAVLREARADGSVGRIGVSATSPGEALEALAHPEVEAIQVAASLLDQRLLRAGFFDRASARGVEVFVRSVYLQGVAHLDPDALPPGLAGLRPVLRRIADAAGTLGMAPADLFLAYARDRLPGRPLIGTETPLQLRENLAAWRRPVDDAVLDAVAASVGDLAEDVLDPSQWDA